MNNFDGPIPGQSLTNTPRNHPWERPPETVDPDEAIAHHLTRVGDPKVMNSVLDAVSEGFPLSFITEMMLTGAVTKGIHSIDISMMIAPVVHDYLVEVLTEEGVEFKEFFEDDGDEDIRKTMAKTQAISGIKEKMNMPDEEPEDEPMEEEETPEEEPKRGLMARPEPEGDMS